MASFTICQAARNAKETMIRTLSDTSQQPKTKPKRRKKKSPSQACISKQPKERKPQKQSPESKASTNACPTRVHVFFQKRSAHSLQQKDGYASLRKPNKEP
jgi:hypothetical protein